MSTVDISCLGVPSDSVTSIENRDGAVLLDIYNKVCLFMTTAELQVWRLIELKQNIDQITETLQNEFHDAPKDVIKKDVIQFIGGLQQTGVLRSRAEISRPKQHFAGEWLLSSLQHVAQNVDARLPRSQKSLICRALLGFLFFDLSHVGRDFRRVEALVKHWPVIARLPTPQIIEKACNAINFARVWYPKYVPCAQHSVVLTCLLRSCGIHAEMVIGAQILPLKAHAWTEVDGRPVNERRNVRKLLIWQRC